MSSRIAPARPKTRSSPTSRWQWGVRRSRLVHSAEANALPSTIACLRSNENLAMRVDSRVHSCHVRPGNRETLRGSIYMRDRHSKSPQPSLEEMLADPIIWTVMKSDGVDQHELRNLLKRVARD